ncbi:MAG: hypothetical protein AB1767_00530 [Bacillota bacterium]
MSNLTVELVRSIKEAESKAEVLVRDARQESRRKLKEAEAKAVELLRSAEAEAEAQAQLLLQQAEEAARAEAEPLLKTQQEESAGIKARAEARFPAAVAMITERIVKFHAYS